MRRLAVLLACVAALAGCGAEDAIDEVKQQAEAVRDQVQERLERAKAEFERRREQYADRIDEVMDDLQRQQQPQRTSPALRARDNTEARTIDEFLTAVLTDVDRYWTQQFATADLPEPRVAFDWVAPGAAVLSGCGSPARSTDAAFYCPADDTIYVGQEFAAALYAGALRNLPGSGRAGGDFAVAYVIAHEYAHNLQQELGIFDNTVTPTAKPFELQADCLSGTWAHSAYAAGELDPGDIDEAADTALAVGDFDVGNAQHHGTPQERREALLTGFQDGDPSTCARYLPV